MSNQTSTRSGMKILPFILLYIIPMLFTYVVRWVAFGLSADTGFQDGPNVGGITIWLIVLYAIMIFATHSRGKANDRSWLIVLPIIGALFDILLGFIPLVPTVMNILVLIFGCMDAKQPTEIIIRETRVVDTDSASPSQD
ncbi:hypothetical protein [Dongshaea marina]|uniref:hypothetical protein n=1 Tax=Dongshaea marina TaxID=2047966 RepID=UPI00131F26A6|nr:hypothetical protein [Dongshaea marina]